MYKTREQIAELIEAAEITREAGHTDEAIEHFQRIITVTNDQEQLASALGHLVICYKHKFQATGKKEFLTSMTDLCEAGLALPLTQAQTSVFRLRKGDVFLLLGHADLAVDQYQLAVESVAAGSPTQAEYMVHLAEALAVDGQIGEAQLLLSEAEQIILRDRSLRPFHRRTILAGIRYKQAKTAHLDRQRAKQLVYVAKGLWHASVLAVCGKPARLRQAFQFMSGKIS